MPDHEGIWNTFAFVVTDKNFAAGLPIAQLNLNIPFPYYILRHPSPDDYAGLAFRPMTETAGESDSKTPRRFQHAERVNDHLMVKPNTNLSNQTLIGALAITGNYVE